MMKTFFCQEVQISLTDFPIFSLTVCPQASVLYVLLYFSGLRFKTDRRQKSCFIQAALIFHVINGHCGFPVSRDCFSACPFLIKQEDGWILHTETGGAVQVLTHG